MPTKLSTFRTNWGIPTLLLLFGLVSILRGATQLYNLHLGPPSSPDEFTAMHYFVMPVPVALHIVCGIIFNVLGALQFSPKFRFSFRTFHRVSGRFIVLAGVGLALTALWMNQFYPAFGGALKYYGVITYSIGLLVCMSLAINAILSGQYQQHRAWMMRAMAIILSVSTQALIVIPIFILLGQVSDMLIGAVVWLGLIINILFVEWRLFSEQTNTKIETEVAPA